MTDLPNKELLRVDEVADFFRISKSTVYLWIDHGILIAEKYGGTIRIPKKEVLNCRVLNRLKPLE